MGPIAEYIIWPQGGLHIYVFLSSALGVANLHDWLPPFCFRSFHAPCVAAVSLRAAIGLLLLLKVDSLGLVGTLIHSLMDGRSTYRASFMAALITLVLTMSIAFALARYRHAPRHRLGDFPIP